MPQQSVKQAARRAALEVTARRRAVRAAREQRIEDLAVAVLTALGEREDAERRVGEALVGVVLAAAGGRLGGRNLAGRMPPHRLPLRRLQYQPVGRPVGTFGPVSAAPRAAGWR